MLMCLLDMFDLDFNQKPVSCELDFIGGLLLNGESLICPIYGLFRVTVMLKLLMVVRP